MSHNETNFSDSLNSTSDNCSYEKANFLEAKFVIVTLCGASISMVGIGLNCISVYVLTRPAIRVSHVIYLAVLSGMDIFILFGYILLFSVQILYDWSEDYLLYVIWLSYCRQIFCISKMMQIAATYLIVAATIERYLTTDHTAAQHPKFQTGAWSPRKRIWIIAAVIGASALFKLSSCWEFQVFEKSQCSDFSRYSLGLSSLAGNKIYAKLVMFYLSNIIRVFLPFVLLVYLNTCIVLKLHRTVKRSHQALMGHFQQSLLMQSVIIGTREQRSQTRRIKRDRKTLKAATRMLIAIVTTHLVSNLLGLLITFIEHIDDGFLESHNTFYTFAVDCINIFAIVNSTIRFPIYYFCNKLVREEVYSLMGLQRAWKKRPRRKCIRRKGGRWGTSMSSMDSSATLSSGVTNGCPNDSLAQYVDAKDYESVVKVVLLTTNHISS